jgi:hypothetical protein
LPPAAKGKEKRSGISRNPAGGLTALLPLPLLSLLFPRMHLPESAFQATSHDDAHDAFMTLSSYISSREDEACYLESGPNPAGWAFELGSAMSVPNREQE